MERTIIEKKSKEDISKEINFKVEEVNGYKVTEAFDATGGEADIFRVKKNDSVFILKLYRFGITPPIELLNSIRQISHEHGENLINIIDLGFDQRTRRYYEILEEAKFGNLDNYRSNNSIDIDEIIRQITDALSKLKSKNILHLDLKPTNILIRSKHPFDLALSDFGMASKLQKNVKETIIKGTETYWSPESNIGFISDKSDYWSLGIIIYELAVGHHPYRRLDKIDQKLVLNFKEIEVPSTIDEKYQLLLKGLLTKNPDTRWGYDEVMKWLDGDYSPVYFGQKTVKYIPMKMDNMTFNHINDFYSYVSDMKNGRMTLLKKAYTEGHISKWYARNNNIDTAIVIDDLREENFGFRKFLKTLIPKDYEKKLVGGILNKLELCLVEVKEMR